MGEGFGFSGVEIEGLVVRGRGGREEGGERTEDGGGFERGEEGNVSPHCWDVC